MRVAAENGGGAGQSHSRDGGGEDEVAVLMVHAANALKCFTVRQGVHPKPIQVQFQPGLSDEFSVFRADVGPVFVHEHSRAAVGKAVRSCMDVRYSRMTIDGTLVSRPALSSVTVGQVPSLSGSSHKVRFQAVRRRQPPAPPADALVSEAVVLSGVLACCALAHASETLANMASSLVDSAEAEASFLASEQAPLPSLEEALSIFTQEMVDEAMRRGVFGHRMRGCDNKGRISESGWASFGPAAAAKTFVKSESRTENEENERGSNIMPDASPEEERKVGAPKEQSLLGSTHLIVLAVVVIIAVIAKLVLL